MISIAIGLVNILTRNICNRKFIYANAVCHAQWYVRCCLKGIFTYIIRLYFFIPMEVISSLLSDQFVQTDNA